MENWEQQFSEKRLTRTDDYMPIHINDHHKLLHTVANVGYNSGKSNMTHIGNMTKLTFIIFYFAVFFFSKLSFVDS